MTAILVNNLQKNFRYLLLAAAVMLFVLIVAGGVVRATQSGGACPDWPTCLGTWTPPAGQNAQLNYLHRLATLLSAPLIFATAWLAWRYFRSERWIVRLLLAASGLAGLQVGLGALLAQDWLPVARSWASALHLGLALLAQAAVTLAAASAFYRRQAGMPLQLRFRSPFARLSLVTVAATFVLLFSGAVVAGSASSTACPSWLLCPQALAAADSGALINLVHRSSVALTGMLLLALFFQAWRIQRTQTPVIVSVTAAAVLFLSQALLGARLVSAAPTYLIVLHQATAAAVWAVLAVQLAAVGAAGRSGEDERLEAVALAGRKNLLKDLLMLTKPVVVLLLLVTTYAGMVIGAQAWPSAALAVWTLLGGFMAAGGSGAINQYIDRFDDEKMQRTQKRPLPSGRLTPGEGLAFGVGMALASFYFYVAFVNFLAALLTLAGIIYYVLLYSIILKKTTVQNIVIGGGAGAIPPLVGWAAATGSLNVPSLFLFAIVFMWTPPHFWALAIVRRKDYARAGVPMLPVVRGERETRLQIFIYTLELVALTLVLPIFGLGGSIYLLGAAVLGLWLVSAAWKVWRTEGNKVAWKMYRYSSMYLAFLFCVLMADRLLIK